MPNVFGMTGASKPRRTAFDLSHDVKMTADMGLLIPVFRRLMVPGDMFKIGVEAVLRAMPMVAPILHEIDVYFHSYAVPLRLLWPEPDGWETYITGGVDGDAALTIPRWNPLNTAIGSLWDAFGMPTGVVPTGRLPHDFLRRAYNMIYNEYYRDETLIDEIALDNETLLKRAWEKDYFTSALPWQQRGPAMSIPLTGVGFAEWASSISGAYGSGGTIQMGNNTNVRGSTVGGSGALVVTDQASGAAHSATNLKTAGVTVTIPTSALNANVIDMSTVGTFDVNQLREVFQIQRFLEKNARGGARYKEFLQEQFFVSPRDDRLQRPEYIGGARFPVVVSEVLQTSATASQPSPQGNMAGHGMAADRSYIGSYYAQEFTLVMTIMSIKPRTGYQQGIEREFLYDTRYEWPFPVFANLGEQPVEMVELYAQGTEPLNSKIFGYQGRFNELRTGKSMVTGKMRTDFKYWHMSRIFASEPALNKEFIECVPRKDCFAAPSEPAFMVNVGNIVHAFRPFPAVPEPGLIDHN